MSENPDDRRAPVTIYNANGTIRKVVPAAALRPFRYASPSSSRRLLRDLRSIRVKGWRAKERPTRMKGWRAKETP